jgi:ketosteroid isomerase-like protein
MGKGVVNPAGAFLNERLVLPHVKETLARVYDALVTGVTASLQSVIADDSEIWIRGEPENLPFAGTWTGPRSVVKFVERYSANVGNPVFRPRYSMLQEDGEGTALMLFVLEEGIAIPTGKAFASESVHEWRIDRSGRIKRFVSWNNSFDFYQAFTAEAVAGSLNFRHPLDEALITPTRPCAVDAGAAVERFYRCLLAEDWAGLLDLMDPKIVSTLEGVEDLVSFSGTYRGIDEVQRQALTFAQTERNVYENLKPRYVTDGNRVCARFDEAGTYVFSTGIAQNFTNLHCFTVNDAGRIETFRSYNDTWRVWVSWLSEEQRPASVAMDHWKRHRYKPDRPPAPPTTG